MTDTAKPDMPDRNQLEILVDAIFRHAEPRGYALRWQAQFDSIPRIVASARDKYATEGDAFGGWMSRGAHVFIEMTIKKFGRPVEPITVRHSTNGTEGIDHA